MVIFYTVAGIVLSVLVVAIIAIVVLAVMKPDTFRIERSRTIKAAPDKVFPLINDFHPWAEWSPWDKLDPNLKRAYCGAASGVGAIYEWEGNKKVGQGRMEITESTSLSRIVIKLDFIKPFSANNIADFALAGDGGKTTVTWGMTGKQPFMFKVMGVFMSMDKMIGKDFEKGLASMAAIAEKT
jgi:hypothetical protein